MSTTLPHGIIQINEGNISWYGDITANWQLIDSKIGEYDAAVASIPAPANNGTLTINYGGTTLAMFGADDAGNVSADIPAPGDGTLTVTQGGSTTLGSFTANQATPETIDIPAPGDGILTIQLNGVDVQTFTANQSGNATANIVTPAINNGTLTIRLNGVDVQTFTANQSNDVVADIIPPVPGDGTLTIKVNGSTVGTFTANANTNATANIQCVDLTSAQTVAGDKDFTGTTGTRNVIPATTDTYDLGSSVKEYNNAYAKTVVTGGITLDNKAIDTDANGNMTYDGNKVLTEGANSIPFHNSYPRCKYLGTSITDAQNTAIKNRTYDDLFIGDYWTINGVNWRIVAIDYYFNAGDTNFDKGNIIVMPDTILYNAQMNETNTTAGAYAGSLMRTQNLNDARTIAQNAFGSHLANHRIMLANSVDASGPSDWAWYNSDGVELPNEVQIYGTRVWGSALKGFDVATQKQQFPLLALAPRFVDTRQTYWLQDVSSYSVSRAFAYVHHTGLAAGDHASGSIGVRPSVTLSYI